MFRTIDRYVLREVAVSWLAVTMVLLAILVSVQVAKILGLAAENGFPRDIVFAFIGLTTLQNLVLLVPISVLLSATLALGRLYHESEMTAVRACGVGPLRLYLPVYALALPVAVGLAWLTFDVGPEVRESAAQLNRKAIRDAQFGRLEPGLFRTFGDGKAVFYAERTDSGGRLANVFMQRYVDDRVEVATATWAEQRVLDGGQTQLVVLHDGERVEGVPGRSDFRRIRFVEHGIPVVVPEPSAGRYSPERKATSELIGSTSLPDIAELQRRISMPIMVLVLALVAVPLAALRPREGRYARVAIAILIYFVYSNLVSAAQVWTEKGSIPPFVGGWWVHLLVIGLGLVLLHRQSPLTGWPTASGEQGMTLLDRYLARTVLVHTLMVLAALVALLTLVTFIGQQDDIGKGSYGVADAFLFTMLSLPQQIYEMLPIATLIGAIIGLGSLARDSELTVVRAAGVSIMRIAASAALAGVVIAAAMWMLGEYFAPPADRYARQHKIFSKFSQLDMAGSSSAWVRQGSWFLNVRQQAASNLFGGVFVYELDADRRLRLVGHAETASQNPAGRWILSNYAETRLNSTRVEARGRDREEAGTQFNAEFLGLAVTRPNSLPLTDVYAYVRHLQANDLDSRAWEIAFWSRIARLVAAVMVCVFAVPFALGPLRSAGAGSRTVLGIMAGVLFVLLTQTLENSGLVYDLNPLLVAWGPTLLLAAIAFVAILRVH